MGRIHVRWKEEVVWEGDGLRLIFEFTMGVAHIYLPTFERWQAQDATVTRALYDRVIADMAAFAKRERVPLTVDDRAWVSVERTS